MTRCNKRRFLFSARILLDYFLPSFNRAIPNASRWKMLVALINVRSKSYGAFFSSVGEGKANFCMKFIIFIIIYIYNYFISNHQVNWSSVKYTEGTWRDETKNLLSTLRETAIGLIVLTVLNERGFILNPRIAGRYRVRFISMVYISFFPTRRICFRANDNFNSKHIYVYIFDPSGELCRFYF